MRTDPEHIAYEAWIDQHPLGYPGIEYDAFVAGYRAALKSQDRGDAKRLDWLERHDGKFYNIDRIFSMVGVGFGAVGDRFQTIREAIDHARHIEGGGE